MSNAAYDPPMPRPLPPIPRLCPRKVPIDCAELFGCPHISPQWELGALRALIKPQCGQAIRHLPAEQRVPKDLQSRVEQVLNALAERIGYRPDLHWPSAGDYLFLAEVQSRHSSEARALALMLSNKLPNIWLILGRLFVQDGVFHRRERGFRLNLVPATNIHLTRPIRSALHGVL
jgi:hypothetical protein